MAGPSARPAPPSKGRERADRPAAWRGARPARRGRGARGGARPQGRGGRGHRGVLSLLVHRPAARGARARDHRRRVSGGLRHHLGPRVAAVPRVRALHDGGDERLHRAPGQAVREPAGSGAGHVRARRRAAHHGVERRRGHAGHGGREARAHAPVGPRGGRARRRLDRRRSPAAAGSSPSTSAGRAPTSASSWTERSARPRRATRGSPAIPSSCP